MSIFDALFYFFIFFYRPYRQQPRSKNATKLKSVSRAKMLDLKEFFRFSMHGQKDYISVEMFISLKSLNLPVLIVKRISFFSNFSILGIVYYLELQSLKYYCKCMKSRKKICIPRTSI